jgi:spore maturation protein CgeB
VYEEEYIKTINGMEIALHFLRHGNRDEQDSRTFEIPACKVFMIAESSELHLQLFKENEEAVFFSSKKEL